MSTFLDQPSQERFADEMSTMDVNPEHDVHDDAGHLIGQVADVHINGSGWRWMARDAWHVEWGDIPGQIMGWAGNFPTKRAAAVALANAVAQRRRETSS